MLDGSLTMKTIILSDTHLTQFDTQLYDALQRVISSADTIIINGDFWDGYLVSFDEFVNSPWKQLFPLLKKKNTIYIYGNHDPEWMCDNRVSLFSVTQTLHHTLTAGEVEYHIQHGHLTHQSLITNLALVLPHTFTKAVNKWLKDQQRKHTPLGWIAAKLEAYFDAVGDIKLRRYAQTLSATQKNTLYVFGHTHIPRFSKKESYLNSGRFTARSARHLLIEHTRAQLVHHV
jgi:predicted phosphodiesterase